MFSKNAGRFATYGVIDRVPGRLIDAIWYYIDNNLKGVVPLENLIHFDVEGEQDALTSLMFSQPGMDLQIKFDTSIKYDDSYPTELVVYDDGMNQTVMLPSEIK